MKISDLPLDIQKSLETHALVYKELGAIINEEPLYGFWCEKCGRCFNIVTSNIPSTILSGRVRKRIDSLKFLEGEFIQCDLSLLKS